MHMLSVVFVIATLAIFGVMADLSKCKIECPASSADYLVCNTYDNIEYTSTKCESINLVKCARVKEEKVVQVTEGACAKHTLDNCETYCDKAEKVCSQFDDRNRTFSSLCSFLSMANCLEADNHADAIKLVGYGDC